MRDVLVALGLAFFPVSVFLVTLTMAARERALKAEATLRDIALEAARRGSALPRDPHDVYQALDAIAVEVERISEGQRFTTRLLSESRGDPSGGRVNTPH
jgi:hypothetical protein